LPLRRLGGDASGLNAAQGAEGDVGALGDFFQRQAGLLAQLR
jgi:hypothetical protein